MPCATPSPRRFPPSGLRKALRDLTADLPRMLIRIRPPRSTPRVLQRPGRGWPTRKPDTPRTRVVDRDLVLHRLPAPPQPADPPQQAPKRPADPAARPPKRTDSPR